MLLSQLIPALALTLGGGHADLHPATTNFYVEVPHLDAVVAAYDMAPFAQFFRDPEIRNFAAQFVDLEADQVSFTSLMDEVLDEVRGDLPPAGVQMLDLIPEVKHLSFSISGVQVEGLADEIKATEGDWFDLIDARLGNVRFQAVMDFSNEKAAQESIALIKGQVVGDESTVPSLVVVETKFEFGGEMLDWTYVNAPLDDLEMAFWFASKGPRVIVGSSFAPSIKKLFPKGETLASRGDFSSSRNHFKDDAGITVMESYFRLEGLQEVPQLIALIPEVDPSVASSVGYLMDVMIPQGKIETTSRVRLVESQFISEVFDRDFSTEDSPRLSSDESVSRDSFKMVPADAVGVMATNLDKAGIKKIFMDWLAGYSEQETGELLATLENKYGFRPDRDLIDALGGEFVFYNMPFSGVGMPKMFVALELNDTDAFVRGLEGLGLYLSDLAEGSVEFTSRPYRKNPFVSFSPGKNLDEMVDGADWTPAFLSLAVAIGVVEDRAIISLSSMYTKREMKRLLKSADEGLHPLLSQAEDLPSGVINYGTTNYAEIFAGVYDSARGLLPLISQGGGIELPFSIDEMPSSDVFGRYFADTRSWTRRVDGGTYSYNESSFGPEVALMACAVSGGIMLTVMEEEQAAMQAQLDDPAPVIWEEAPKDEQTQSRMREMKVAIVVYKSDVGRYPSSLVDLLAPTPNFPSGFLDSSELPRDGWGNTFHYITDSSGSTYRLWSTGPDGTDQDGGGDDLELSHQE